MSAVCFRCSALPQCLRTYFESFESSRFHYDAAELCIGENPTMVAVETYAVATLQLLLHATFALTMETKTQSFSARLCTYFEWFEMLERQLCVRVCRWMEQNRSFPCHKQMFCIFAWASFAPTESVCCFSVTRAPCTHDVGNLFSLFSTAAM